MKTLENFLKDIDVNEQLSESFKDTKSLAEMCDKAKQYGYDFTEDELTESYLDAVSGGALVNNESYVVNFSQSIDGQNNLQFNYGDITVSGGDAPKNESAPINSEQKFQILSWVLNRKN